jgi:hypothetical protein
LHFVVESAERNSPNEKRAAAQDEKPPLISSALCRGKPPAYQIVPFKLIRHYLSLMD